MNKMNFFQLDNELHWLVLEFNQSFIPMINPAGSWYIIHFICCWIRVIKSLCTSFASMGGIGM